MDETQRPTQPHRPPARALPDLAGQEIAGYRILRLVGIGGMGRVYRALDTQLGHEVAIKFVSTVVLKDPRLVSRFEREIQLLETVDHPNVAHIYGQGEHDGVPYFVMEYIEGISLARLLKDGKKLSGKRCLDLLIDAAEGLHAVHRQGIVHRDVKPSNLMIDSSGHLKIVDFGVARRAGDEAGLTSSRAILGTPRFMSPEQAVGADTDQRSDIYSLGVTFYTLFAGSAPFDSDDPAELRRLHITEDPPRLKEKNPRVPPAVEAVIHRMMEKRPDDRYSAYPELIGDLRRARLGAAPAPGESRARESASAAVRSAGDWWSGRPAWLVPGLGAAAVLLIVLFASFAGPGREETEPAPIEQPPDDPFGLSRSLRNAFHSRTMANMMRLAANIESYRAQSGFVPDELRDLVDEFGVPGPALIDGWGRPFVYEHVKNGYRLISLGMDARRSGDDLVMEDGVLVETEEQPRQRRR